MQWRQAMAGIVAGVLGTALGGGGVAYADADAEMRALVEQLQQRVLELEDRLEEQETASVDVQRLEGEVVTLREDMSTWRDVDVASGTDFNLSGYVETSYNFNFNDPRGQPGRAGTNLGRIFDTSDDTFVLDAVKLELENTADEIGDAGFRVDLIWGNQGDLIGQGGARGGVDSVGDDVDVEFDFEVEQAYVNYIADVGNGLEVKAGRFVTWIGYEVIETHANPNISRAFTFGYSIPFIHTGVGASYQFNDMWAYSHYLVNGWDNAIDDNDAKSTGGQLVFTPPEDRTGGIPMEFYFNWITGQESNPEGDDDRFVLDWIVTAQLNDQWGVALNVDYGESEFEDASVSAIGMTPAGLFDEEEWFGIAGYITYQHSDALGYALRVEYWEEDNGLRTGLFSADRMPGEELGLFGITGTANYWLTDNLLTRGELRYDSADEDVFFGDGPAEFEDDQFTIAWNATYLF